MGPGDGRKLKLFKNGTYLAIILSCFIVAQGITPLFFIVKIRNVLVIVRFYELSTEVVFLVSWGTGSFLAGYEV